MLVQLVKHMAHAARRKILPRQLCANVYSVHTVHTALKLRINYRRGKLISKWLTRERCLFFCFSFDQSYFGLFKLAALLQVALR